jgi:hypothetical protein
MNKLTDKELAIIGLRVQDIPDVKPDRVRAMIAQNEKQAKVWSIADDDREKLYKKNDVLRKILAEVECRKEFDYDCDLH